MAKFLKEYFILIVIMVFVYIFIHFTLEKSFFRGDILNIPPAVKVLSRRDNNRDAYFLLETAHHTHFVARSLCGVESVARLHPDADVYLLVVLPPDSFKVEENEALVTLKRSYKNVFILSVELSEYFKNTPLEEWYNLGTLNTSKYLIHHMSDVLRSLTLWKYGGTYLDTDIIIKKSLKNLKNFVCAENHDNIASAILNLGKNSDLASQILLEINKTFDGSQWAENGPYAITRVIRRNCKGLPAAELAKQGCDKVKVLPVSAFNTLDFSQYAKMFDANQCDELLQLWNECYGVHFWNKMSANVKITINSKQPLGVLAKEFCPKVYYSCNSEF